MYYVTFLKVGTAARYTVRVIARSAKTAMRRVCRGDRVLVCVTLTPPTNVLSYPLGQYA